MAESKEMRPNIYNGMIEVDWHQSYNVRLFLSNWNENRVITTEKLSKICDLRNFVNEVVVLQYKYFYHIFRWEMGVKSTNFRL